MDAASPVIAVLRADPLRADISDSYAIRGTANLGLALAATESIIEEVESLAPGSFYRKSTAAAGRPVVAA